MGALDSIDAAVTFQHDDMKLHGATVIMVPDSVHGSGEPLLHFVEAVSEEYLLHRILVVSLDHEIYVTVRPRLLPKSGFVTTPVRDMITHS